MNHGHSLFIEYLNQRSDLEGKTIIEIGSVREDLEGQNSTKCFLDFCKDKKMKLSTIFSGRISHLFIFKILAWFRFHTHAHARQVLAGMWVLGGCGCGWRCAGLCLQESTGDKSAGDASARAKRALAKRTPGRIMRSR